MMDMGITTRVAHGRGIGGFREAGKGRTAGRCFHQARAPRPKLYLVAGAERSCANEIIDLIHRTTRHRSRNVALYVSPAGAVFVLGEDLSVSHQRWARAHEAWLAGWYTCTATVEDILAGIP
jgi:hypothetical protein